MTTTNEAIGLVIVSIVGAVFASFLGWLESGKPFAPKKFIATLIRGIIAGLVFVLGYQTVATISWWDFISVFIGGAGFDALLKRGQGVLKRR